MTAAITASVLALCTPATGDVFDFPETVFEIEDVPAGAVDAILVIISGGFTPYIEKRWLAWSESEGNAYRIKATEPVGGGVDIHVESTDPAAYKEFFGTLEGYGVFELATPEPAGPGAPYVTDLPTYRISVKSGDAGNDFSVRNPAAAGDERYSEIIEAVLDYFGGD